MTPKRPRPVYRDELGADLEFLAGGYRYEVQVQLADDDDAEPEFRILVQDAESVVEELASAGAADLDEADFLGFVHPERHINERSPDVWLRRCPWLRRAAGGRPAPVLAAAAAYGPAKANPTPAARCAHPQSGAEPAWA